MAKNELVYPLHEQLDSKTDEELVALAIEGNQDAVEFVIQKYKELVNIKVNKYFIIGAEKEDIVQEGMIGLYKAIKCYETDKQSSFKSFANMCIERQLITAIKTSTRQKHIPLNSSVSLNTSVYEEDDNSSLIDVFNSNTMEDPLDTLTKKEYYKAIGTKMDENLSKFEKQVLTRYARGESYVAIAKKLEMPVKSIDNAIQRIRKKANRSMETEE